MTKLLPLLFVSCASVAVKAKLTPTFDREVFNAYLSHQEHSACIYGCHAGVVITSADLIDDAIAAALNMCEEMCDK